MLRGPFYQNEPQKSFPTKVQIRYRKLLDSIISNPYISREELSKSLRDRFNVRETSAGSISRLIKEVVSQERIKALDPDTAKRYMRYIPIWA